MKRVFMLLFVMGTCLPLLHAQLLKGLKDKVAERIANSLAKKGTDKSSAEADSIMNQLGQMGFNPQNMGSLTMGMGYVDPSVLPDAYVFSHLYRIRMQSAMGNIELDYYLTKSGNYMANVVKPKEDMKVTMVYDYEKKLIVNYLGGKPMVMRIPDYVNSEDEKQDSAYVVTTLPNKVFLGYDCIGKQMENKDYVLTLYIASDLAVGMCNPFQQENGNPGPAFRLQEKDNKGGMIMHMNIVDKTNKGEKSASGTMECILFEEKENSIKNR